MSPQAIFMAEDDDRGSGRLQQRPSAWDLGFRGSGRVNPNPQRPNPQSQVVAYRGSGRIQPANPART